MRLFFLFFLSFGVSADLAAQSVHDQAQRMATALVSGDYRTFAQYTNPAVIKAVGGEDGFVRQMEGVAANMQSRGMRFSRVNIGEPGKIFKSAADWECTVAQETEIKVPGGRVVARSTLLAISVDGGKNWTFVDTSNKSMAALRQLLPKMNPGIVISPAPQPERYSD